MAAQYSNRTWSVCDSDWDMEFNPSKCQVVQVTGYKKHINAAYRLHDVILETVTCGRYLGVDISSNLTWGSHIDRITGTANKTLGFVKRNIRTKISGVRELPWSGRSWNMLQPFGIPIMMTKSNRLRKSNGELHVGQLAISEERLVLLI